MFDEDEDVDYGEDDLQQISEQQQLQQPAQPEQDAEMTPPAEVAKEAALREQETKGQPADEPKPVETMFSTVETEKVAKAEEEAQSSNKLASPQPVQVQLPPDWKVVASRSGDVYYYNSTTGESTWNTPTLTADRASYEKTLAPAAAEVQAKGRSNSCVDHHKADTNRRPNRGPTQRVGNVTQTENTPERVTLGKRERFEDRDAPRPRSTRDDAAARRARPDAAYNANTNNHNQPQSDRSNRVEPERPSQKRRKEESRKEEPKREVSRMEEPKNQGLSIKGSAASAANGAAIRGAAAAVATADDVQTKTETASSASAPAVAAATPSNIPTGPRSMNANSRGGKDRNRRGWKGEERPRDNKDAAPPADNGRGGRGNGASTTAAPAARDSNAAATPPPTAARKDDPVAAAYASRRRPPPTDNAERGSRAVRERPAPIDNAARGARPARERPAAQATDWDERNPRDADCYRPGSASAAASPAPAARASRDTPAPERRDDRRSAPSTDNSSLISRLSQSAPRWARDEEPQPAQRRDADRYVPSTDRVPRRGGGGRDRSTPPKTMRQWGAPKTDQPQTDSDLGEARNRKREQETQLA